ncbi:MAG: hypothetical protein AB1481_04670 [Candidatus Omnitrophota bacterium]
MRKSIILALAALLCALAPLAVSAFAAGDGKLSKLELAECLVKRQSIELPAGVESLPEENYYKVVANALARSGINIFLNSQPNDPVSCFEIVDILGNIAGLDEKLDSTAKINSLVQMGYLSKVSDPSAEASTCEQLLCNPPVAEAFSPAPEDLIPLGGPEIIPEDPASQT